MIGKKVNDIIYTSVLKLIMGTNQKVLLNSLPFVQTILKIFEIYKMLLIISDWVIQIMCLKYTRIQQLNLGNMDIRVIPTCCKQKIEG